MDVLSDVLSTIRLTSDVRCRAELRAPWGFGVPASPGTAPFYMIERGSCYLEIKGGAVSLPLVGGDVVMVTQGVAHTIRDSRRTRVVPLEELIDGAQPKSAHCAVRHGGDGAATMMVAGSFHYQHDPQHPLVAAMPPLLHLPANHSCVGPWMETTLRFIASETQMNAAGSSLVVARLTDILFVQLVRSSMARYVEQGHECDGNLLRALADRQIARALDAIHRRPEHPWTVGELAAEADMSRTAFATRFAALAGLPPLTYATRWRMLKAGELLSRGHETMMEIAERVGYESEAAFSKAFKREMGTAPGAYRRRWGAAV